MEYTELYEKLKNLFYSESGDIHSTELNVSIQKISFVSERSDLLLGSDTPGCIQHQIQLPENENNYIKYGLPAIDVTDFAIECNKKFSYYILKKADTAKSRQAIIFLHGLNEKKWDKYLPWAYELAQKTGKAVILFPIAFHMDRADPIWSDHHQMMEIATFRSEKFPDNSHMSFVNSAISSRLEAHPQRIFWAGFQTYSDIICMISDIRKGKIQGISQSADFDLFGYSIGAFLSMILKMADPDLLFTHSKLFCFCGGMTMDRMFPISKYIMDSRAAIHMQAMFAELLSSNFRGDKRLAHFQNEALHPEESWFKKMLRYNYFQQEREDRLRQLQTQIKAYVLEKDEVAPPAEALNTLKGKYRNLDIEVEIKDYPFSYSHMTPFPLTFKNQKSITQSFEDFISSAARFYSE